MAGPLLILASRSPRRVDLLSEWGIPATSHPADIDEEGAGQTEHAEWARTLAERKAAVVRERFIADVSFSDAQWVLGADTVVSCGRRIYGKPDGAENAIEVLSELSGKELSVVTGVALLQINGVQRWVESETSCVVMRPFGLDEIVAYVATGEPFGKAGSFAVQGEGRALIEEVRGSLSNVIGLPRRLVKSLLAQAGIL